MNEYKVTISKMRRYKPGEAKVCRILLYPDKEGGFSAYCLRLPDVASHGATAEEALDKIVEAFRETVLRYRAAKQPIPWVHWDKIKVPDLPGAKELRRTVLFNVDGQE
ncbi:MAG TPA: type II toxin-antitoxin system HicB family antitoxin [Pirellulales bacterium]|nr:type II toxin-antitoxin system HicB family antitoxin [Pirellulales bacterium]